MVEGEKGETMIFSLKQRIRERETWQTSVLQDDRLRTASDQGTIAGVPAYRLRFNCNPAICRRVNDPCLPRSPLHARTAQVTTEIVQTATGEETGMEITTNGIDVTETSIGPADETETIIPKGVLGGPHPHRRGLRESRGTPGLSRPPRGDGRVHVQGQGHCERMKTRTMIRTRTRRKENRTLEAQDCWQPSPRP